MACLAILFCVDLSVYAVLTNKHTTLPDPEAIEAVVEAELVTATPASSSSTPADPTSTETPAPPAEHVDPDDLLWEHTYGDYVVKTIQDPSAGGLIVLQIFKAGTLVYATNSTKFFDPEVDAGDDHHPTPFTNITGNGIPNLVIYEWSDGVRYGSGAYLIYELGAEFREVDTIPSEHGEAVFADLDGNGSLAIKLQDSYDDAFPELILRYTDGKYQLAPDLMFTEPPTDEQLAELANDIEFTYQTPSGDGHDIPPPNEDGSAATLWQHMLDLTYQGHVDLALQLFDICWQADWEGKDEAATRFWKRVAMSPHGQAVVEAQGYELPVMTVEEVATAAKEK